MNQTSATLVDNTFNTNVGCIVIRMNTPCFILDLITLMEEMEEMEDSQKAPPVEVVSIT